MTESQLASSRKGEPRLRLVGISKVYPSVVANDAVHCG